MWSNWYTEDPTLDDAVVSGAAPAGSGRWSSKVVNIAAVVVDQAQRKLQQRVALQQMAQLA